MSSHRDEKSGSRSAHASLVEQQIAEELERSLQSPWKLEQTTKPLDISTTEAKFRYTPDFLIRNESNGHVLAVEVKSSLSLSMANVIRFQQIQTAVQESGADFLLVVHDAAPSKQGENAQLSEYGVNAVGVTRPVEAAVEIEKKLR